MNSSFNWNELVLDVSLIIYGFFYSIFVASVWLYVPLITVMKYRAMMNGLTVSMIAIAGCVGSPLIGLIHDYWRVASCDECREYQEVSVWFLMSTCIALCLGIFIKLRDRLTGNRLKNVSSSAK